MAADKGRKEQIENGTGDEHVYKINKAISQVRETTGLEGGHCLREGVSGKEESKRKEGGKRLEGRGGVQLVLRENEKRGERERCEGTTERERGSARESG